MWRCLPNSCNLAAHFLIWRRQDSLCCCCYWGKGQGNSCCWSGRLGFSHSYLSFCLPSAPLFPLSEAAWLWASLGSSSVGQQDQAWSLQLRGFGGSATAATEREAGHFGQLLSLLCTLFDRVHYDVKKIHRFWKFLHSIYYVIYW